MTTLHPVPLAAWTPVWIVCAVAVATSYIADYRPQWFARVAALQHKKIPDTNVVGARVGAALSSSSQGLHGKISL
jgi:hypothetical protein